MTERPRSLLNRWYNKMSRMIFTKLLLLLLIPNLLLVFVIQQLTDRQVEQKASEIQDTLLGLGHAVNREISSLFGVVTTLSNQLIIEPEVQRILTYSWREGLAPNANPSADTELRKLQMLYDNQALMQSLLSRYRLVWSNIYSLAIVDTQGNVYLSTAQNYQIYPEDLGASKLLKADSDDPLPWSINDALTKNENMITISRKIYGTTMPQQVIGRVIINLSLREIQDSFDTYNYFGKMVFGLSNASGNGNMIYDGRRFSAEHDEALSFAEFGERQTDVSYHGTSWHMNVRQLEGPFSADTRNYLFVGLDNAYIREKTKSISDNLIFGYAVFLIVALGISLFGATVMSRRIGHVLKGMRQFGQEKWGTRIAVRGSDEISIMGSTFNSMASRIEHLLSNVAEEQNLKRLFELRVLEYQINPHFLYNTLDTIHWLALDSNRPQISRMVEGLSKLFRIILSKGNEAIALREEFEMVRIYLDIHKIRLEDRFDYEIRLEPEVREHKIGKLVLQPLVENALLHGIRRLRTKGMIMVSGKLDGGEVVLTVADNGVGMPIETLDKQRRLIDSDLWEEEAMKGSGYGMKNVDSRLKLMFGEAYSMRIESGEGGPGTRVTIRIRADG
ncbi:HAMP domain-containing protein [Paenibacillus sp. UNCCL117]|uniref:cache domain-containing sensor histidine kinase n=1 Tax=unclassified Paenibacillus TaxID=185978 RepID=UPI000883E0DD|nr:MULTISPECIES: sensor histidine kinase [unclassified Paenibacillus]SDD96345.1 HAMP domain-containing protein [Paenibacillus sp. cl123]SFW56408.1 HAMP domain-containing protein [Paenibacillus sp. UNCCL117]